MLLFCLFEIMSFKASVAKSTVIRERDNEYIVHVIISVDLSEVFRGKFNLEVC